ncbi:DUF2142 domain-containing protein [Candidatus Electronema halotolerans]
MQFSSLFSYFFPARPLHGLNLLPAAAKEEAPSKVQPWLFLLILTAVFSAAYYFLIFNRALVELELETDTRTVLKFYWPDQQGQYSEKKSAQLLLKPGRRTYSIRVTDISGLNHLRLDPSENKTAIISIHRLAVRQIGFPLWELRSQADFAAHLRVLTGVEAMSLLPKGGIRLWIKDIDPQLELVLPNMVRHIPWLHVLEHGLGIFLLACGCLFLSRLFSPQLEFIPLLAVFALALIMVMAAISGFNTHPDESVHAAAGSYYINHSLPPRVGDPAIADTYSVYGVSRLHSGEIYYLLAGKFLRLLKPLHLPAYQGMRLFNVLLFFILIVAAGRAGFRPFFLPLLISPQIWYLFSYADSEALSLFFSLLAAWQLAAPDSPLNRLLRNEPEQFAWLTPLHLGLLLGLLLLQKLNFYPLYVFFFCYFFWRLWLTPPVWSRRTIARFLAIILIGGFSFSAVKITDVWVNDFKKGELELAVREQRAEYMYKPSTPLAKKHPYLQLCDRGKTLRQMLEVDRWGENSFRTAFGVYGYTQYSAPFAYYDYVRVIGLLLLLVLAIALLRAGLPGLSLLGLAAGWSLFFLAVLIYHAWTEDFQAQGRYLLPMLPMLAMLYYHCQRVLSRPLFYSVFVLLFLLSVYNFIFIGLHDIGRSLL